MFLYIRSKRLLPVIDDITQTLFQRDDVVPADLFLEKLRSVDYGINRSGIAGVPVAGASYVASSQECYETV